MVSEASKHGIHLILTLVNNWDGYGGKKQYVQWAREQGHSLNNDDEFFTNTIVKGYFKNYIKVNSIKFNFSPSILNNPSVHYLKNHYIYIFPLLYTDSTFH